MKADVVIVGGGPGGSASSLFLAEKGISSLIVERDAFPRFHIGESMTGECGGLVRKLGFENEMLRRGHDRLW
ncbi:MAG: FAD-dependent monooxygenase [Acidimicrobiia bacterium]